MRRVTERAIPFKIFGLQRTGTNVMAALLTQNFYAKSIERWTDWKHGRVEELLVSWNGVPVRYVVCARNPYAWLVSCYRYFQKAIGRDPTLPPQFVQNPTISFEQFLTTSSYEFVNPVDRWNRLNRHWLEALPSSSLEIVKHEELLDDQVPVLVRLERGLRLSRRHAALCRIHRRVDVVPGGHPVERGYYLNGGYMSEYTPSMLDCVDRQVDKRLVDRFDYFTEQSK